MKLYYIIMLAALTVALVPFVARTVQHVRSQGLASAFNIAGTHDGGCVRRLAEGSGIVSRHLLVKPGTDPAKQVAVCGATDEPSGCADDAAADGEGLTVERLSATDRTRLGVASKAIAAEARLYTTGGGKVTDTAVNDSWLIGKSLTPTDADGDEIEFEPCMPVQQSV